MVTKMIEKEVLAKAMRKTKEDEAAQGGGRATMVAENTMGVKPHKWAAMAYLDKKSCGTTRFSHGEKILWYHKIFLWSCGE